jgi:hypothetical protein
MNDQNREVLTEVAESKSDINIRESIELFVIGQIGLLIEGDKKTAYVKFLLIINCIEFLGAALAEKPIETEKQSEERFNNAIKKLFSSKYRQFANESNQYYFYRNLRCGMVHQLRPLGKIGFTTRQEAKQDGNTHLAVEENGFLVLVLEDFYDDLKKAALKYIRDSKSGKITTQRGKDAHVSVYNKRKK